MLQEKKSSHQESKLDNANNEAKQDPKQEQQSKRDFWNDKQYTDLVFYLFIAILLLELVVAGVAFFYGIIHATPDPNGGPPRFQFPWLAYALAAVLVPAALLLILHLFGFDVFRTARSNDDNDETWQNELPTRLRKAYIVIKNAPTVVLLVGILLLGAGLVYVDGAINALFALSKEITQYLPWIIGAIVLVWCVGYAGRMWFAYRTRRLEEEYAFRREIFERTGQIIVDRGAMQLPPAEQNIKAIEGATIGGTTIEALPLNQDNKTQNDEIQDHVQIIDVTTEQK